MSHRENRHREDRHREDRHREDLSEHVLPRFSLQRRITVLVMLATVLVVGAIATLGIPLELVPRGFDEPSLQVQAMWQDAPAQEVLDKVVLPLEEELSTVPGIQDLFSFSTTGFGRCFLSFKLGTDMDVTYREVRDRVERAKARLPADVDRVLIRKHSEGSIPVLAMGLAIDEEVTDVYNLIQNEIVMPLQRIDGVADVTVRGLEEREILIELDRERVAAAGLNVYELGNELGSDNFTMASGHVLAADKKLMLRSVARYADLEALENRLVGPSVRLKDVATVRYDLPEQNFRVRAMSKPAMMLIVMKEGEANPLAVSRAVAAEVERMRRNPRLEPIELEVFFDQGKTILESLGILFDSGKIGGVFAALVLFFFLRRFRMTLIITMSIPVSLLLGVVAMYFFGETLNLFTLLGLMISVGLLVDNSVVVAENIFRLHRAGLARRDAAIQGAGEISLAIVMATLTTVIVFLPVSLVEGVGRFFLLRLAIPITVSLTASLLVALVFVPLAVYLTLPETAAARDEKRLGRRFQGVLRKAYEATFGRLNHGYNRLLGLFLRRRMDLVMAVLAVIALSAALPFQKVKLVPMQEEERSGFGIDVVLPQSTTLEEAEEYFRDVEKVLEARQRELDLDGYFIFHTSTWGEVEGWLNNPRTTEDSPREITEAFLEVMPEKAGSKVYTGQETDDEDEDKNLHVVTLVGEDAAQLEDLADGLEEKFAAVPGVLGVKKSGDVPAEELALRVDRDQAQRLGISPEVVAGVVRNSLGGRALPKFYRDGREIPVRIRFQEADRESLAELYAFQVPTAGGDSVPLQAVTEAERLDSTKRIWRRNKRTSRTITLELAEADAGATRERLVKLAAGLDLPEGVTFGAARRGGGADEDLQALMFAAVLSVVFIYLLMGFLFESFLLPLSIVPTIPLAIIGVWWTHYATGYDVDPLGFVGVVILIGVVVNNGIVLIDYVNRLRASGEERSRAVLDAADRRFRPIMMTALTTICGMVPLTFAGTTSIGLSYKSFGLALIGGMTTATMLTLLVVPVAYTLFDDARNYLMALMRRAVPSRRAEAGAR
ncbi:MAG TPA: efflux RND transporter permease subunit [Thermoanaerobaculia bacterium]|jgi:HAE1 family hydrophobic/amphiphilic exporter-1